MTVPSRVNRLHVRVREQETPARRGSIDCVIGVHLDCDPSGLSELCSTSSEEVVHDALLVAAAVEFCDKALSRGKRIWGRDFELEIPVHNPDRWTSTEVTDSLRKALSILTGDTWSLTFTGRRASRQLRNQEPLALQETGPYAVLPFSDGLDSLAVDGITRHARGDGLLSVRLGKAARRDPGSRRRGRFVTVPYHVSGDGYQFRESSGRSRGFKFATVAGLAAYVSGAGRVIVPESGQGAIGPVLVPVGHAVDDLRNHPKFARYMETYLEALLGHAMAFDFPRLWSTKGETIRAYMDDCKDPTSWRSTRSCWQPQYLTSVNGTHRQCGICAACMLRRMSIHAAGLIEQDDTYAFEDLSAPTLEGSAAQGAKASPIQHRNAVAGVLHLAHLADLRHTRHGCTEIEGVALNLSGPLREDVTLVTEKIHDLLRRHESEWKGFKKVLGRRSFVANPAGLAA